ncbi:hypothetical protein O1L68_26425 [Streptomyces lydicus]|nr:hypothetical protein [Streptomyces lydicus]
MATSLAAQAQAEREFTADVAHELRTPVAGLVAAAELLPQPRAVELVRDRAQAMRRLVEDLLEVSRLDAGWSGRIWTPVSCRRWCAGSCGGRRASAGSTRCR